MDRTKKRKRKSPETPSVLHRLGPMVSGFNRARGERTGKSSGNVVSPVPTLRPWHVQPSVWHPQNDSNAWIQRQIMTKTGANESTSGSKQLRAMNLRYVESKISKLHQSMHLLSKIHRGKPLLVLGGHLDQIWDCHRMPSVSKNKLSITIRKKSYMFLAILPMKILNRRAALIWCQCWHATHPHTCTLPRVSWLLPTYSSCSFSS